MLFVAALLFMIICRYSIHVEPYNNVVTNCIPVYKNAFQTSFQYKKHKWSIEKRKWKNQLK
jgi:hypothetical protein